MSVILYILFQGKAVIKLAYEAYQEMAEKEMRKLCGQAREKWNVKHIALHHRQVFFIVAQHLQRRLLYQM